MRLLSPNPNRDISTGAMWRDKRGVAAVEFALMGSALVLLVMAATDLALAVHARAEVGNAARAGTDYAAAYAGANNGAFNSAGITTAVTNATSLPGVTATPAPSTFCGCATASGITQQTQPPCGPPTPPCPTGLTPGTYVSVTAQANYSPLFPTRWNAYLVNKFVTMSATETTRTQ
ncbi:MAG: TadE/TadG family type IV pilus assembly protein [Methylocella sp.]